MKISGTSVRTLRSSSASAVSSLLYSHRLIRELFGYQLTSDVQFYSSHYYSADTLTPSIQIRWHFLICQAIYGEEREEKNKWEVETQVVCDSSYKH